MLNSCIAGSCTTPNALLQAAADLFEKAVTLDPTDDRSWLQWGLLERRRRQHEAAARCFAQGVRVAPRNPYLWQVSNARQHLTHCDMTHSLKLAAPARLRWRTPEIWPPQLPCHVFQLYGATLFGLGRANEGRAAFRDGVHANPSSATLLLAWALAEEGSGIPEGAEAALGIYAQVHGAPGPCCPSICPSHPLDSPCLPCPHEQGAALPEQHTPLLVAYLRLAQQMGRAETVAAVQWQLEAASER